MRQPQPPKAIDALAEELCILFSNYYQDLSAKDKDQALKKYIKDNKRHKNKVKTRDTWTF